MLQRFSIDPRFRILVIWSGWVLWWILTFIQSYNLVTPSQLKDTVLRFTVLGVVWALVTPLVLYFAKIIKYENNLLEVLIKHFLGATLVLLIRSIPQVFFLNAIFEEESFFTRWQNVVASFMVGSYIIYGFIALFHYSAIWFAGFKDSQLKSLSLKLKSEQLERQLSEANLTALRMQLNPHFLFNTLNSVASLIRIQKNNEAIETLSTLSDLLRSTVYEGIKTEVTIREEINFIKQYLTIEQLRFSDRLVIAWDVDESVLNHYIPTFLLQPLVENALKHGLKETKHGRLFISIKSLPPGQIAFLIQDNGIGLSEELKPELVRGVGLKNTMNRLKGTYSDLYSFSVTNNVPLPGVKVQLTLPVEA